MLRLYMNVERTKNVILEAGTENTILGLMKLPGVLVW